MTIVNATLLRLGFRRNRTSEKAVLANLIQLTEFTHEYYIIDIKQFLIIRFD